MLKEWITIIKGCIIWKKLVRTNSIDDTTVILILSGENEIIDNYALMYLDKVIERKRAKSAVVFVPSETDREKLTKYRYSYPVTSRIISEQELNYVCSWYRMVKFSKNIFFTYTDKSTDNLLGRFLRETEITEKEAVCLAIYNFRTIPMEN